MLFWIWVEVYALILECKELISRWILYFCWNYIILNVGWRLKVYELLLGCKKKLFLDGCYIKYYVGWNGLCYIHVNPTWLVY